MKYRLTFRKGKAMKLVECTHNTRGRCMKIMLAAGYTFCRVTGRR